MGNNQAQEFSTATQLTFNAERYVGMWYQVYNSDKNKNTGCDVSIAFYFMTGDVLNMSTYCVINQKLVNHVQHTGIAPNPYDPTKFVVRTEGIFNQTFKYWIYDTDYDTYSIVGTGIPRQEGTGSDFIILSRKPRLSSKIINEIRSKVIGLGLASEFLL